MSAVWSEKEINALRDGWRAGMSMQAVAVWVGRSRNAVAGKIKRLGLTLTEQERLDRQAAGGRSGGKVGAAIRWKDHQPRKGNVLARGMEATAHLNSRRRSNP